MDVTRFPNERGQASIIIALMIATFLTFFSFVAYTGLLVNAKINLQNAADLAAYAGASVQARQLNNVSFLNYEMRRQYKKFLFRYYVIGNMSQKSHPDLTVNNNLRIWTPTGNPADDLRFPAVCIIFNNNDNYCQVATLTKIPSLNANPLDGISVTLSGVLNNLEQIRQNNCNAISSTNGHVLFFWLFNTDPYFRDAQALIQGAQGSGSAIKKDVLLIPGLSQGMGLVTRNTLLAMRIKTLEYYLNYPAYRAGGSKGPMTVELANDLNQNAPDPASQERALQAFYSAYYTLGEYIFDDRSIELSEMLPEGPNGSDMVRLNRMDTDFETYFIKMRIVNGDCVQQPELVKVRDLPIGFAKDPSTLTYYAIRLKAKVRLPFSPFRDLTLSAYSAAQPFGSRIGPDFTNGNPDATPWVNTSRVPSLAGNVNCTDCVGVPNLPAEADEALFSMPGQGWNRGSVIREMFGQFAQFVPGCASGGANGNNQCTLGPTELEQAYQSAMVPNPPERAQYNIINDLNVQPGDPTHEQGGDPFVANFDSRERHAIWAPLVSPDLTGSDPKDEIDQALQNNIQGLQAAGVNQATIAALIGAFGSYVGKLLTCNGQETEDGECFKVVQLRNPFKTLPNDTIGGSSQPISMNANLFMSNPSDIKTSWADVRLQEYKDKGRVGYSVKYVSFDTLTNPGKGGQVANGPNATNPVPWTNPPFLDSDAGQDVPFLKH